MTTYVLVHLRVQPLLHSYSWALPRLNALDPLHSLNSLDTLSALNRYAVDPLHRQSLHWSNSLSDAGAGLILLLLLRGGCGRISSLRLRFGDHDLDLSADELIALLQRERLLLRVEQVGELGEDGVVLVGHGCCEAEPGGILSLFRGADPRDAER